MKVTIFSILVFGFISCSVFKRAALKYWTSHQVEEFIKNCETNASKIMAEDKAMNFCDCAVDVVAKEYPNYADLQNTPIKKIISIAKSCQ